MWPTAREVLGSRGALQRAKALGVEPVAVRNYVCSAIEERLWRGSRPPTTTHGFRFVRGSHGGPFVPVATDGTVIIAVTRSESMIAWFP